MNKHHNSIPNAAGRLGVDIGRVIMCPADADGRPDTSFLDARDDDALEVPPTPHVLSVLPELVELFSGRVWLISKAGSRIEQLTRRWFEHHSFFERSGVLPDHVRFCRRRADKRTHTDELAITHFIDDRADVLSHLRGGVENLYLFGVQTEPIPEWVVAVPDWLAVRAVLRQVAA
jgi:hypothetical protein